MELPFEREAMRSEPMPEGLRQADIQAYLALRLLYKTYKAGYVTRDAAQKEKREIVKQWQSDKSYEKYVLYQIRLTKASEAAKAEYRRSRTIENADRLVNIMDGLERPWITDK